MHKLWSVGIVLALAGCGLFPDSSIGNTPVSAVPTTQPDITGTITEVSGTSVRIEENPAEQSGSNKAVVRLPESTTNVLFKRTSGSVTAIGVSDLKAGQRARAWFDGPVAESYPLQARAKVIVVE